MDYFMLNCINSLSSHCDYYLNKVWPAALIYYRPKPTPEHTKKRERSRCYQNKGTIPFEKKNVKLKETEKQTKGSQFGFYPAVISPESYSGAGWGVGGVGGVFVLSPCIISLSPEQGVDGLHRLP